MLKIWGRKNSINVQKVLWCCEELGLPFERVDVGGPFVGNDEPWYLALNPTGLVPTISDDGFVLWESNAIVRYLAARYGAGTFWPQDPQARAEADRWMDFQATTLWANLRPVFLGLRRTPPEERDEDLLEASRKRAEEAFAILDAHLNGRGYIGGSSPNMGDIPLGAAAYRWFELEIRRPSMPSLEAWYERLRGRPAYRANIMLPLS